MNNGSDERYYDPVAMLSYSLVVFVFAAWIPLLITWILLLFSPTSPSPAYEQFRRAIVIVTGAATAAAFAGAVWTYRRNQASKAHLAQSIARHFGSVWRVILVILLLLECNILAFLLLRDIAPSITGPFRFTLLCWSVVFAALMLTVHWRSVQSSYRRAQATMAVLGGTVAALLLFAILITFSNRLINITRIHDQLRGALDYRPLEFIDDGAAPSPPEFWAEQSTTYVRWLPYSYWTLAPFDGAYINVDKAGLRHIPSYTEDPGAPSIYFFGGSTLWGLGARDAYTIPAQVAQLLAQREQPAHIRSYAQTGYVSWQDLLLFQAQLALDNVPGLAVFYHGFNDVYAAYLQGGAGLTLRENQRVSDVELGRLLRSGQPVLFPFDADISGYDWGLVTSGSGSPGHIAERWFANRRLIRATAEEHDVPVLFVWQPTLYAKAARTVTEQQILDEVERVQPGFVDLYREVVGIVRERAALEATEDILFLTDAFRDVSKNIFFDRVHINEIGNRFVAESLITPLMDAIPRS